MADSCIDAGTGAFGYSGAAIAARLLGSGQALFQTAGEWIDQKYANEIDRHFRLAAPEANPPQRSGM